MRPSKRGRVAATGDSRNKVLIGFFAGIALVLAIVVVVLLSRGGSGDSKSDASTAASRGSEPATPAAPPALAARSVATVRAELDLAASATKALSLADEARAFGDADLAEAAVRRAFDLDATDPDVARAAEVRSLDPDHDFPGLSAVRAWPQAYLARRWIERKEPASTRWQREALAKEWDAARAIVEERHRAAESDPYLRRIDTIASQVSALPVFEKMRWRTIESTRPFALFVETRERDDVGDEAFVRSVEQNVAPYLAAFRAELDETLLSWLGQKREPGDVHVVWVLRSFDRYREIVARIDQDYVLPGQLAHYDSTKRWSLACLAETGGIHFQETMQILLHELVHSQIDACARQRGATRFRLAWLEEGLAEYLSAFKRHDRDHVFWDSGLQPRVDEFLREIRPHPELEDRIVLPRLLEVDHMGTLADRVVELLKRRGIEPSAEAFARFASAFYADSFLLVRWLIEADGGRRRDEFVAFLRDVVAGVKPADAVEKHLAFLTKDAAATRDAIANFTADDRMRRRGGDPSVRAGGAAPAIGEPAAAPAAPATCLADLVAGVEDPVAARALRWAGFLESGGRGAAAAFPDAAGIDARLAAAFERSAAALLAKWSAAKPKLRLGGAAEGAFTSASDDGIALRAADGETRVAWRDVAVEQWAFYFVRDLPGDDDALAAAAWLRELSGKHGDALTTAKRVKSELGAALLPELDRARGLAAALETAATLDACFHSRNDETFVAALPAIWKTQRSSPYGVAAAAALRARFATARTATLSDAALLKRLGAAAARVGGAPDLALGLEVTLLFDHDAHGMASDTASRLLESSPLASLLGFGGKVDPFAVSGSRLVPRGDCLAVSDLALTGDVDFELACVNVMTGTIKVGYVLGVWEEEAKRLFAWHMHGVDCFEGRVPAFATECGAPDPGDANVETWSVAIRRRGEKLEFLRDGKLIGSLQARRTAPLRLYFAHHGDPFFGLASVKLRGALAPAARDELARSLAEKDAAELFD